MSRLLVVLALFVLATPARANVSRKDFPGMRATEPGGLRDIAIEHETLTFDLRPIANKLSAQIAATYQLDNRSTSPITAPLVFVSGMSRLGSTEVQLDGKALPSETVPEAQAAKFPAAWNPPLSTPNIDGDGTVGFDSENPISISFTATIPPGRHTLAISYSATPAMTRSHGGAAKLWQIGYVLSPARDWGSFGTLDVTIEAPDGWRVAVTPRLERTGNTLRGKFTGLPQDTIGISVSAPIAFTHHVARFGLPLLVLGVVFAGGYLLFAIGRARGRGTSIGTAGTAAFGLGLLWGIAIAVAGCCLALSGAVGVPEGQSASHGYGAGLGAVFAVFCGFVAIPIGYAIVKSGVRSGAAIHAK